MKSTPGSNSTLSVIQSTKLTMLKLHQKEHSSLERSKNNFLSTNRKWQNSIQQLPVNLYSFDFLIDFKILLFTANTLSKIKLKKCLSSILKGFIYLSASKSVLLGRRGGELLGEKNTSWRYTSGAELLLYFFCKNPWMF